MKKIFAFLGLLLFTVALPSFAQSTGMVTVQGSLVHDSSNNAVSNATITFTPVQNNNQPISFRRGGSTTGQIVTKPIVGTVTNGGFSVTLPDTALTYPQNVCFTVTVVDNASGDNILGPGYTCVQPTYDNSTTSNPWCTAGTCNFDNYLPSTLPYLAVSVLPQMIMGNVTTLSPGASASAGFTTTQTGTGTQYTLTLGIPTGAPGTPGATGPQGPPATPRGTWTGGTAYNKGDVVSYTVSGVTSSYAALQANSSTTVPPSDTTDWMIYSQGSGSNALSIQGQPVSSTTPSNGNVQIYQNGQYAPGSPQAGYQPPGTNTQSMNRDNKFNVDLSPQNYGAVGEGTWEAGDLDAIYQQELLATDGNPNHAQTKVHGHGLIYLVNHANALYNFPTEYGDYLNNLSGSGAFASFTVDLGKITACSGSGGSGYDANGYLPIQFIDKSHQGSGATGYVPTNGSGVPIWSSCTMMTQGMNYPSTGGLVTATVLQTGADGATANCGTLVSGAFPSVNCTVTAAGSGFAFAPSCGLAIGTSQLQGTTVPNCTATVSAGGIATVTLSGLGSGLTWNGSANGGLVTVCIGQCIKGAQATNLVPLTPAQIGIGLPLRAGVDLDFEGGWLVIDDPTTTTDLTKILPIGDPWGDQGQNITIENVTIVGMIDVLFAGPLKDVTLKNVIFVPRLIPNNAFLSQGATGSSLAVYMPQALQNVVFDNVKFDGNSGVLCGGIRSSRTAGAGGMGSLGGTDISEKTTAAVGGDCDGLVVKNSSMYSIGAANTAYSALNLPPLVASFNSYSAPLDTFVEQYFWQSQYSNLSNPEWNYSATTCPTLVTPQTQRDVDFHFGNTAGFLPTNPYFNCYRGVSDMMVVANSRYGYLSRGSYSDLFRDSGARPLIVGSYSTPTFRNIVGRYVSTRAITGGDPYIPSGAKWNGIIDMSSNLVPNPTLIGVFNPDTTGATYTQTLGIAQNTTQNWTGSSWTGVTPVGTQLSSNSPASQITVSTNYLNNPANIPGSTVSAVQTLLGIDAFGANEIDFLSQYISLGVTSPIAAFGYNSAAGWKEAADITQNGAWVGLTKGIGTNTWVVGTAFGTTPPTASLPTGGTSCESNECTVTLTAAAGATTGTMITFTLTVSRHDVPSCTTEVQDITAHTKFNSYTAIPSGSSVTTLPFIASVAPTVGDVYYITARCGGY